jgi:hypothetical protein
VDRHDVGLLEQRVDVAVLAEVAVRPQPPRVEHAQLEPPRAARNGAADPAEPEDAERRARQLLREPALRPRSAPTARADEPVALHDLPPHGEDQREGEVGGRLVEHARRVGHDHPARRARGDVDPVVADAEVRDDAQRGQEVERDRLVREDQPLDILARLVQLGERHDLDVELVEGRPG